MRINYSGLPSGLHTRALAVCLAGTIVAGSLQGAAVAGPAKKKTALEQNVDGLVQTFIDETGLPGMTVAVSNQGRLVFTKAYGEAMVAAAESLPMTRFKRSNIGSVTKAVLTGPSAYQLLKAKNIDPATQTLYGPDGLFGDDFDADIDEGIDKFAPESANWKDWYGKITLQDMFDHTSGFDRTASKANAAEIFGVTEDELTYEQYHRYFLRTHKLLFEPSTDYEYSNHGFGLFTLVIEKLAGKSFAEYVRDDYLKPMNLHNGIQGSRPDIDSCDAHNHNFGDSEPAQPQVLEFGLSRLGLAAGGFRSSAQDLARVMKNLEEKYTWDEIDRMGWFRNSKGRLDHKGLIDGGTASVVMFPEGYESSGNDLSGVQVAVATNVRLQSGDIDLLARYIALEVPASNVSPSLDLWPGVLADRSCEYTRYAVPAADYQGVFDRATKTGYRLEWIDGYAVGGNVFFNAIFRSPGLGSDWVSHHNMTGASYQEKFDNYVSDGYSPVHVDSYTVAGTIRYAAIWKKDSGAFHAYHGKSAAEHQKLIDNLTNQGWRPRVISVASVSGTRHYTAVYTKQSIGDYDARSSLTAAEYQQRYDENKTAGRRLRYLNAYNHNGQVMFSAIWSSKPVVSHVKANHGISADQLATNWRQNVSDGFETRAVTGYEQGAIPGLAAYWSK